MIGTNLFGFGLVFGSIHLRMDCLVGSYVFMIQSQVFGRCYFYFGIRSNFEHFVYLLFEFVGFTMVWK